MPSKITIGLSAALGAATLFGVFNNLMLRPSTVLKCGTSNCIQGSVIIDSKNGQSRVIDYKYVDNSARHPTEEKILEGAEITILSDAVAPQYQTTLSRPLAEYTEDLRVILDKAIDAYNNAVEELNIDTDVRFKIEDEKEDPTVHMYVIDPNNIDPEQVDLLKERLGTAGLSANVEYNTLQSVNNDVDESVKKQLERTRTVLENLRSSLDDLSSVSFRHKLAITHHVQQNILMQNLGPGSEKKPQPHHSNDEDELVACTQSGSAFNHS
jgi:hypothetical protein